MPKLKKTQNCPFQGNVLIQSLDWWLVTCKIYGLTKKEIKEKYNKYETTYLFTTKSGRKHYIRKADIIICPHCKEEIEFV